MMFGRKSTGYKAVFLKRVANGFLKVKVTNMSIDKDFVTYKDKTFPFSLQDSAYVDKGFSFYFFDIDENKQLSFREFKFKISPDEIDNLVTKHVISNLITKIQTGLSGSKGAILMYIVFIGVGIGIGYMIGQQFGTKEVIKNYIQNSTGIYQVPSI